MHAGSPLGSMGGSIGYALVVFVHFGGNGQGGGVHRSRGVCSMATRIRQHAHMVVACIVRKQLQCAVWR